MAERVAFVTSAAKGLGHVTVKSLIESGWDVCFTYRSSEEEAQEILSFAKERGRRAHLIQADLLQKSDVDRAAEECLLTFGRVDALVHNFGPFVFERIPLADYTEDMWSRMFDGNIHNFFWLYSKFVKGMRQRGFGRIVTIGYDGADHAEGWRFRSAYAAAKAGLTSLTRTIAREERQNGITANMVCPGDIRGNHKVQKIRDVEHQGEGSMRPPVGEDVARVIVFLCHSDSQKLSGTITEVTGGYDILAYDDGTDTVVEPDEFQPFDRVFVFHWQTPAQIEGVTRTPNRNVVYHVAGDGRRGSFTAYQLSRLE